MSTWKGFVRCIPSSPSLTCNHVWFGLLPLVPSLTVFTWSVLQGQMRYEVTGDLLAPSLFGVDESSGNIFVLSDLKEDDDFEYSVSVKRTLLWSPSNKDTRSAKHFCPY